MRCFLDQELTILAEFLCSRRDFARECSEKVCEGLPVSTRRGTSLPQIALADLVPPQPDSSDLRGGGLELLDQPFDKLVQPITGRLETLSWIFNDLLDPGL